MGCKQITVKRPEKGGAVIKTPLGDVIINGDSNHAPTAGPVQVKVHVHYRGKVVHDKTYKEDVSVDVVHKEIVSALPVAHSDSSYVFFYKGNSLLEKLTGTLKSLLVSSSETQTHTGDKNTIQTLDVQIDVSLTGLGDLSDNVTHDYKKVNLLAKPLVEPFELAIFEKKTGKIRVDSLSHEVEKNSEIKVYSELSAYCNGGDHLFISGGEFTNSSNTSVILGHFWDIDLNKRTIYKSKSGLSTPRKLHSMLYVPNNYVFIVGGIGVKSVEVYNTHTQELTHHSELNEERTEPALALINNSYLYAFSGFMTTKNRTLNSFERINLRGEKKTWEAIHPTLDSGISFTQNFFAVSHHTSGNLIFIGGIQNYNQEGINTTHSHTYDYNNNVLKLSDGLAHLDAEFSEKFFYPIDEGYNVVLPNFERENINLLRYTPGEGLKNIFFENDNDVSVYNDEHHYNEFTLLGGEEKVKYITKENTFTVEKKEGNKEEHIIVETFAKEEEKKEDHHEKKEHHNEEHEKKEHHHEKEEENHHEEHHEKKDEHPFKIENTHNEEPAHVEKIEEHHEEPVHVEKTEQHHEEPKVEEHRVEVNHEVKAEGKADVNNNGPAVAEANQAEDFL